MITIEEMTQRAAGIDGNGQELPELNIPPAKRISELEGYRRNDERELLRDRYLCRGGGLLLVAQTGIGKSVALMQAAILWALGRPAFGIRPAHPLKSLIIQAENDEVDLHEFAEGIARWLELSDKEIAQVDDNIRLVHENARTGHALFAETVEAHLQDIRPDLLWLDPANSYIGGDTNTQQDVGRFLRNQLNPLLTRYNCGGIVIHHTNKPPRGKDKPDWAAGDFAYLGAGSAEWANWARAVLSIRSVGSHDFFELVAGKRGQRLEWVDDDGSKSYTRYLGHSQQAGLIYWRDVSREEMQEAMAGTVKTEDDLIALVPSQGAIAKSELLKQAQERGIGQNKARGFLAALIDAEPPRLHEWHKKRVGTNPLKLISRHPQTLEEV